MSTQPIGNSRLPLATTSEPGAMSPIDKSKLDGLTSGSVVQLVWTDSGLVSVDGQTVYTIPAPASGKITVLPGDGQTFYTNYSLDLGRTQLTFNSVGDVPPAGSRLEFLYGQELLGSASADAQTLQGYTPGDFAPDSHVGSGGAQHSLAVANGAAGFMSGADKMKLDGLPSTGFSTILAGGGQGSERYH